MRAKQIQSGVHVWTKISGKRVRVKVIGTDTRYSRRTKYIIARRDNGKLLSKRRSSASLHICGHGYWAGLGEKIELEEACADCARDFLESGGTQ
jgi:hypothetical protein